MGIQQSGIDLQLYSPNLENLIFSMVQICRGCDSEYHFLEAGIYDLVDGDWSMAFLIEDPLALIVWAPGMEQFFFDDNLKGQKKSGSFLALVVLHWHGSDEGSGEQGGPHHPK